MNLLRIFRKSAPPLHEPRYLDRSQIDCAKRMHDRDGFQALLVIYDYAEMLRRRNCRSDKIAHELEQENRELREQLDIAYGLIEEDADADAEFLSGGIYYG